MTTQAQAEALAAEIKRLALRLRNTSRLDVVGCQEEMHALHAAIDRLRDLAASAQASEPVATNAETWSEYIAGLIVCYLGGPIVDDDKIKPIAGIIRSRLRHLDSTAPAVSVPAGWSIKRDGADGDEMHITAPRGTPGGMTAKSTARGLPERLLHALASALLAHAATKQEE